MANEETARKHTAEVNGNVLSVTQSVGKITMELNLQGTSVTIVDFVGLRQTRPELFRGLQGLVTAMKKDEKARGITRRG